VTITGEAAKLPWLFAWVIIVFARLVTSQHLRCGNALDREVRLGRAGLVRSRLSVRVPAQTYLAQKQDIVGQEQTIAVLQAENTKLAAESAALQSDATIEKIARSEYGLVSPGQQAFMVLPSSVKPRAAAPQPGLERHGMPPWSSGITFKDLEALTVLLGRPPRGPFEVVVSDDQGGPVVIRNAPLLDDGTPMPTRYWLVGRRPGWPSTAWRRRRVNAAEAAVDPSSLRRRTALRGRT